MTPLRAKYYAARVLLKRKWSLENVAMATGFTVEMIRELWLTILDKKLSRERRVRE